jgi:CRISPR/Cas system-associated exonuclease Cas4 (RecB family)
MNALPFLRPSVLVAWGKCPKQVEYFYVQGRRVPPGIAVTFGKSIHKTVLDLDQQSRIDGKGYRSVSELKEFFHDDFQKEFEFVDAADPDALRLGGHEAAFGQYTDQGVLLLERYNEKRDAYAGRSVESVIEVPFADTVLRGTLDVDFDDSSFLDIKTRDFSKKGAKRQSLSNIQYRRQYQAYSAAKAKLTGKVDQYVSEANWYKCDKPFIEVQQVTNGPAQHEYIENVAAEINKSINAGAFPPVDKSSQQAWVCSARFCGMWPSTLPDGSEGCPFGQRGAVSVAVEA